jgi:hypothetical protein
VVVPGGQATCSAVEVARAHIAAAERGRCGDNYILAGEVASLKRMVDDVGRLLAIDTSGVHVMPAWLFRALGVASDIAAELTRVPPTITSEMADILINNGVLCVACGVVCVLCCVVLCCVVLCYVMLCCVVLWCVVLCCVELC